MKEEMEKVVASKQDEHDRLRLSSWPANVHIWLDHTASLVRLTWNEKLYKCFEPSK